MRAHSVGVVLDIDGVLQRGPAPIPGAAQAVTRLVEAGVPHVFVTNSGHTDEQTRGAKLATTLGVPAGQDNMLLCHSSVRVRCDMLGSARSHHLHAC